MKQAIDDKGAEIEIGFIDTPIHRGHRRRRRTRNYVAEIARFHEEGVGVPKRDFLAPAAKEIASEFTRIIQADMGRDGAPAGLTKATLKKLAEAGEAAVRRQIRKKRTPRLARRTRYRRITEKPLIASGHLLESVSSRTTGGISNT